MSLTERTIVVFPVPNPSAIITFTERVTPFSTLASSALKPGPVRRDGQSL